MLRIGIDGRPFQGNAAGTGRYGRELCKVLSEEFPEAQFFVYSNRPITMPVVNQRWVHRCDHSSFWSGLPASFWYLERVRTLVHQDKLDLFWGGANLLPRGVQSHCPCVVTVLDVVPALFPETMTWKHRLVHEVYFDRTLKQADCLVTISNGSAHRIEQIFGRKPDEIVYPCVSNLFMPPIAREVDRVRQHYGLERSFLLAVATLEPRKNLPVLLQALINLRSSGVAVPDICLVGQAGWRTSMLRDMIDQAGKAGIRIVQTGFVPDDDLPALYAASSAFLFTSVYEGFGMPVLEAINCGARVFAADVPEIREAGSDRATYFEPTLEGITKVLGDFLTQEVLEPQKIQVVNTESRHDSSWKEEGRKLAVVLKSML